MSRLTSGFVLATSLLASYAHAESQAEIASKENEEGKQLMFQQKYADASAKFQDAVARVPEAKYFFNLCMSLYQEGKFGEALTACNSVDKNGADDALKTKASKLEDKIKDEAQKQGVALQPTGGGGGETNVPPPDGNNGATPPPDGNNGSAPPPNGGTGAPPPAAYAVGRPPTVGVFTAAPPQHTYTWTLGIDLYGGGGRIGQPNAYGSAAGGFRIKSDYLLNPAAKMGAQAYLQVTNFGASNAQMTAGTGVDTLDIVDIGIAGYKHFCQGSGRLCFTPLLGIQLALLAPGSQQMDATSEVANYASMGGRIEGALSYALGTHYEHVLSAQVGVNVYTAAFASPSDPSVGLPADQIGLDKGGAFAYLGIGYTYRFNTPFGTAPFVTLE